MKLELGKKDIVTAIKCLPYGAVVELEDKSTKLIHISKLSDSFVSNVEDVIEVGSSYEATAVNGKVHEVELSLKQTKSINKPDQNSKEEPTPSDRIRPNQHAVRVSPVDETAYSHIDYSKPSRRNRNKTKRTRYEKEWF